MRKLLIAVLAIVVLVPAMASADSIGLDMGILSFNPREKTGQSGIANFMTIKVPVDANSTVGFYNEGLGFNLDSNKGGGATTTVAVDVSIQGLQVTRKLADKVSVGLNFGMADITANIAGVVAFTDNVPMADVFVQWSLLSGGEKMKSDFAATIGYRAMMISPIDPDAAGTDYIKNVKDLGGFWIGMSVGFGF
jgi:hypothetical protein